MANCPHDTDTNLKKDTENLPLLSYLKIAPCFTTLLGFSAAVYQVVMSVRLAQYLGQWFRSYSK